MGESRKYISWNKSGYLPLLGAVVCLSASLIYVSFLVAFIGITLLYLSLLATDQARGALQKGLIFGGLAGGALNYWMVPTIQEYAGSSLGLALLCWLVSAAFLATVYGALFGCYALLRDKGVFRHGSLHNALLFAALWVLFEWVRGALLPGMPWFSFSIGVTQARDLFLLQPAAVGGVFLLSFLVVLPACLLAKAIWQRSWQWALAAVLFPFGQFIGGWALYTNVSAATAGAAEGTVRLTLVRPALPGSTIWDERQGNALVGKLLDLNRQAMATQPDLILWTETVVPWTYSPDDDFLAALTEPLAGTYSHALFGMSTAAPGTEGAVFNSAYLLSASGKVQGRYDKHIPLTFIESPVSGATSGLMLPFLGGEGLQVLNQGRSAPLESPWGKVGMLICNEATEPALVRRYGQTGVSFLISMGNDGWFSNSYIPRQHFYNARVRAVEARKDLAVNTNEGVSGLIRASGEIAATSSGASPGVLPVELRPNRLPAGDYALFLLLLGLYTGIFLLLKLYHKIRPARTEKERKHPAGQHAY